MEVWGRLSWTLGIVGCLTVIVVSIGHAADTSMLGSAIAVPVSPPDHLVVEKGKPVELTLTSATIIIPHNFIIKDPAGSLSIEQDVSAGKTVTVRFVPTRPGLFPFFCDKRLWPMDSHRDKGMEGLLEVK